MDREPLRILVVDDEPDIELLIRQKFRRHIKASEIEFSFAGDGVEALDLLKNGTEVDILLTDINMPRMDGLSLLNRVQELNRLLKVVIVSAYGDMENIRTAMNRGAFDFITKPIDFDDLEITINKTRAELDELRKAVKLQSKLSALHRELEIASQIQVSMLPSRFPAFPDRDDVDLYATMVPAQEVGGDFYDFFLIDDHRLAFVLGDVSGKGVGAALLMAITKTLIRATGMQGVGVAECMRRVNHVLYPETVRRMFVTAVFGVLDTRTGDVEYCNAGHFSPVILRSSGDVSEAAPKGDLGLCLVPEFSYSKSTLKLEPGDELVIYSDGVTEAVNVSAEQFGSGRLFSSLRAASGQGPTEIIRGVLKELSTYSEGRSQADDITMLAIRFTGRPRRHEASRAESAIPAA